MIEVVLQFQCNFYSNIFITLSLLLLGVWYQDDGEVADVGCVFVCSG